MVRRLLLANDLPGVGKVALATSIPLAAACQVETMLLPTVLLSSHTGGFPDVVSQELTDLNRAYLGQCNKEFGSSWNFVRLLQKSPATKSAGYLC
ncbi:TPA: hypothetical protein ACHVCJ_001236 [Streptococcus suis]